MFNVVNPDMIVEKYGADTLRLYEMFLGIVDADDLSGEPYYMTAVVAKSTYNTEKTKKKTAESPIFYNLPGSISLTLTDGKRCLMEKTFAVGQFGISVALPAATFKEAETILFCPKSGAILSIE